MFRRTRPFLAGVGLALGALGLGCDYSKTDAPLLPSNVRNGPLPTSSSSGRAGGASSGRFSGTETEEDKTRREEILKNVITLVQSASTNPGGANFDIAIKNLNHYFERGTQPSDFKMSPEERQFLLRLLPEKMVAELEAPVYALRDARHLEDCMLYNAVATRVAGEGEDLARVRRLFEWTMRQVQLVPQGTLAPNGLDQAPARPYDCLVRGMATEFGGYWAERGWVFMSLCRQIGIDVGILSYSRPKASLLMTKQAAQSQSDAPVFWLCAAIVDGKPYLFDTRLGIEILTLDNSRPATLQEAADDPRILERLDLPGQVPYDTKARDLRLSPSKIGVMIDGSSGYLSPRMRLLQQRLTGKNRTILFRDPVEQAASFQKAFGNRAGEVQIWLMPIDIETRLLSDPQFVASTQASLRLFDGRLPLLYARLAQLRGETTEAVKEYVSFRFAKGAVMKDKKTPIVPEVQEALDAYATYFLALSQVDLGNKEAAKLMFQQTLKMLPQPGPGQPYYYMFRWGAMSNLARIAESQGDVKSAVTYYSQLTPTVSTHGDLLRARALVFKDPFLPVQPSLPKAPERMTTVPIPAAPAAPKAD